MCQPWCLYETKCSLVEKLQNSWMLLDEATAQSPDELPPAGVLEFQSWGKLKVFMEVCGRGQRKLLSFPKCSQVKTASNFGMSACSTPLLRKQWFLSTIHRLFWSMVISMIYQLQNCFPLCFFPFCHRLMLNGQKPNVWSQVISFSSMGESYGQSKKTFWYLIIQVCISLRSQKNWHHFHHCLLHTWFPSHKSLVPRSSGSSLIMYQV